MTDVDQTWVPLPSSADRMTLDTLRPCAVSVIGAAVTVTCEPGMATAPAAGAARVTVGAAATTTVMGNDVVVAPWLS
jgi:hypothetical protein